MSNNACILIKSQTATVKTINRPGKAVLNFNEQNAALETGDDFPKPFKLTLQNGQQPYPPGRYMLDLASHDVGDFSALVVGRNVQLVPLAEYARHLAAFVASLQPAAAVAK